MFELSLPSSDQPDFRVIPEVEQDAFHIAAFATHHDLYRQMVDGSCIVALDYEDDACLHTGLVRSMPKIEELI